MYILHESSTVLTLTMNPLQFQFQGSFKTSVSYVILAGTRVKKLYLLNKIHMNFLTKVFFVIICF